MYKGLDIVTAKATKDEQSAIPHHLLDVAHPGVSFTVVSYRNKALPIVSFFSHIYHIIPLSPSSIRRHLHFLQRYVLR